MHFQFFCFLLPPSLRRLRKKYLPGGRGDKREGGIGECSGCQRTARSAFVRWGGNIPWFSVVDADGVVIEGFGVGASGSAAGEVCFNIAMTGNEEI
jgi:hypothetical protein